MVPILKKKIHVIAHKSDTFGNHNTHSLLLHKSHFRKLDAPYLTHTGGADQIFICQEREDVDEAIADQVRLVGIHIVIDDLEQSFSQQQQQQ